MNLKIKKMQNEYSIVEIREFIKANSKNLTDENLTDLYKIICTQKKSNEKFLFDLLNSNIFQLAYKALRTENRCIQDMSLEDFLSDGKLVKRFATKILNNMIVIKEFIGRRENSSKIAKIKYRNKNLTQQK